MSAANYGLLDQVDEDAYHKSRLLNIEMRPFARIARRLLSSESLVYTPPRSYPTPPPDGDAVDEQAAAIALLREKQAAERQQWREEMLLDIANLEETMSRIQLLRRSNEAERERYAEEKIRIIKTADLVRQNTVELRAQLGEAQKTLAMRKTYDELTEKITSNKQLRPRQDQHATIEKLEAEIEELERESGAYAQTWAERREQFGRIVEEGKQMLRLIRDEKEEAERKEGMEEADGAEGSRPGTPAPGTPGGLTPASLADGDGGPSSVVHIQDGMLAPGDPATRSGSRTSSPTRRNEMQQPEGLVNETTPLPSRPQSRAASRAASPPEEGEDIDMIESGELDATNSGDNKEELVFAEDGTTRHSESEQMATD